MTEKEALHKFYECAHAGDFPGCLAALKDISAAVINEQNDDGYDLLIEAVVAEDECAVEALLQDGRCDWSNREYLCGMTAEEFALEYSEYSGIRLAFEEEAPGKYIFRNGKLIPREEIFDLIMTGALEADEGCLYMLPDDLCVDLAVQGKVSDDCWESTLENRPELEQARKQAQNK